MDSFVSDFIKTLNDVTLLTELKSRHDRILKASIEGQALLRAFSVEVKDIKSSAEAEQILVRYANEVGLLSIAQDGACLELQAIANGEGLGINLVCQGLYP
jgi:hypothetical protein